MLTFRRIRARTHDPVTVEHEPTYLRFHLQVKRRIASAALRQEVQKIPLRHQRQELAVRRQMAEVTEGESRLADLPAQLPYLGVRNLEKVVDQPELVENFQGRWMHGVAAEVSKKIGVLLEDRDVDAGSRQQVAEHHAGGSTAGDDAVHGMGRHRPVSWITAWVELPAG